MFRGPHDNYYPLCLGAQFVSFSWLTGGKELIVQEQSRDPLILNRDVSYEHVVKDTLTELQFFRNALITSTLAEANEAKQKMLNELILKLDAESKFFRTLLRNNTKNLRRTFKSQKVRISCDC